LNAQIAELFAGMYGDIDRTGRLGASAPEAAAQVRGRRLVWRLEDSVYADTLGKLTFTPPPKAFPNGDRALVALTDAVTEQVRTLDAVSRMGLFEGLLRLHRGARTDATRVFVPAAKQLAGGAWPDSGGKEAAERFLRYVE
jgi:hypothetical protein